MAPEWVLGIER